MFSSAMFNIALMQLNQDMLESENFFVPNLEFSNTLNFILEVSDSKVNMT